MSESDTPRSSIIERNIMVAIRADNSEQHHAFLEEAFREIASMEEELTTARAEIERLDTVGIHSCHDNCQRWTCVLRRERDETRAELAELKEEYGTWWAQKRIALDELKEVTEQRDEARRLAERYRNLSCDSQDEADETLLPWETTNQNEL